MEIFPATSLATIVAAFGGVVADNIVVIIGVLGTFAAVGWVTRKLGAGMHGKAGK